MSFLAWPVNNFQVGLATPLGASSSTRVGPRQPGGPRGNDSLNEKLKGSPEEAAQLDNYSGLNF